jgi:hypothetical protein
MRLEVRDKMKGAQFEQGSDWDVEYALEGEEATGGA